jgi:hypothetical protein
MNSKSIEMKLGKSTKGTHVYTDDRDQPELPFVYIKKCALPETPPKTLTVKLEWDDG